MIDDFKTRFPEFDATSVDSVFAVLLSLYPAYYGGIYSGNDKEVILQLLAHLFMIETEVNRSLGGVVDAGSGDDDFFNITKYGQSYLMLIRHRHGGLSV